MSQWLKQSTAFTFRIGPFLDSTDGDTAETALTIGQADIQISKNGGAFAQTSASSPTTTHDTDGWYQCPLTATDTNTLGPLTVKIREAGALVVWKDFMVVPGNVYDSIVGGSDLLNVNAAEVDGAAPEDAADIAAAVRDQAISGASAGSIGERLSRIPNVAPAANGGLPTVDASNRIAGIAGTINTLDALDTAQDAQHATTQGRLPAALVSGRMDASVGAMASGVVTATAIASNAITDAKIANNAITAAKLATDAITDAKVAASAVTKIQNGLATAAALATVDNEIAVIDGIVDGIAVQTTRVDALIEDSSGDRFRAKALEQAPSGTGASAASIRAEMDANSTQLAAIREDTENIQTRIPAALNNGVMPADVQRIKDTALTGTPPFDTV